MAVPCQPPVVTLPELTRKFASSTHAPDPSPTAIEYCTDDPDILPIAVIDGSSNPAIIYIN